MATAESVATSLRASANAIDENLDRITGQVAQKGLAKVRALSSGRPGPRKITGDYHRSMTVETIGMAERSIGTNDLRARRLEYGFYGLRDRLNRLFHQKALPHWGPMADWIEPVYEAAVDTYVGRL